MLLGVDVGGTFTDAVVAGPDGLVVAKAPSTPQDQSEGVMAAVDAALTAAGVDASAVEAFAHGMTVGTNALLEGRGARTALVATEGFADLVELGRQARADLYRLCEQRPAPLVPPERRFGAPERMGPDGPVRELDRGAAAEMLEELARTDPESVAVVLLHAYRHPQHECALGALLRERLPGVHVSLSHEVVGTFREYERAATTEVDAALSPLVGGYLRRLSDRARERGLPAAQIMQSNGGLADVELAAEHAALTVLSGPAGGAAGAAFAAAAAGEPDALCFDMGGTSCDVCVVDGGEVREAAARELAGRTIALPMLDLHTVGAGGGSIAWRDAGGALRVGPRSAGAHPGPAAYGQGGEEPTVTDANIVLGYLPHGELAGGVRLDPERAARAVDRLADELGLDRLACAEGIVRVASVEMARALRVMTVERGVDPRRYALVAFGGAGPLHAGAVADELEMDRIVCPRGSGVLAAFGLAISDRRRDAQRTVLLAGAAFTAEAIRDEVEALAERARAALPASSDPAIRVVYDLRYAGQAFELSVERDGPAEPDELRDAFHARHEERYGYADRAGAVELVTIRVTATVPGPDVELRAPRTPAPERDRRTVIIAGGEHEADVLRGELPAGVELTGPAIAELPETTILVPPGWAGAVHPSGALKLERVDGRAGGAARGGRSEAAAP